jgi:hypothetical protein
LRAYVAVQKVVIKSRKTNFYSIMTPRPPSLLDLKSALYCVVKKKPPITLRKLSAYIAFFPPPPRVRQRKGSLYSVIKQQPPVRSYRHGLYSVLKPRPPVRAYSITHYAVIKAPPVAVLLRKLQTYAVIQGGNSTLWKGASYSILFPITNGPSRAEKLTKYVVMQYIEPPNGFRIINVG